MGSYCYDAQRVSCNFKRGYLIYFWEEGVKQNEPGIRPAL